MMPFFFQSVKSGSVRKNNRIISEIAQLSNFSFCESQMFSDDYDDVSFPLKFLLNQNFFCSFFLFYASNPIFQQHILSFEVLQNDFVKHSLFTLYLCKHSYLINISFLKSPNFFKFLCFHLSTIFHFFRLENLFSEPFLSKILRFRY